MNVCIYYYDSFCEFEVVLTAANLTKHNLFAAALENRPYVSSEKQRFLPDKVISELDPKDIDLFVIPGGDPSALYENAELKKFITELNKMGKYIAGICGGTFLMASYGLLDGKRCTGSGTGLTADMPDIDLFSNSIISNDSVVIDGNTITAAGQAFAEMSMELGKLMGVYNTEEEALADYKWVKNIRE